jgi:vacuolar protein sorting-associated protein 54
MMNKNTNQTGPSSSSPIATTTMTATTTATNITVSKRELAMAQANNVIDTMGYKHGRFENFNLLGVVTTPRYLLDVPTSSGTATAHSSNANDNANGSNTSAHADIGGNDNDNNNGNGNDNTKNQTPATTSKTYSNNHNNHHNNNSLFSSLGSIESYMNTTSSKLSTVSESLSKEIGSLNTTLYSYSRNYLGNDLSTTTANMMAYYAGVGSYGGNSRSGNSFPSSLDYENELYQLFMDGSSDVGSGGSGSGMSMTGNSGNGSNSGSTTFGGGSTVYKVRSVEELPTELTSVDLSSVEGYIRKCGFLAQKFDILLHQLHQQEQYDDNNNDKEETNEKGRGQILFHGLDDTNNNNNNNEEEEEEDPTASVPEIFFSPFFDLTDPKTFESLLVLNNGDDDDSGDDDDDDDDDDRYDDTNNKNNRKTPTKQSNNKTNKDNHPSIHLPKPEKLTQYLDLVELSILNQVRSKSDSFFLETNRFSYLKSLVTDLVMEVKELRSQLDTIRQRNITQAEMIPVMDRRRKDIRVLGLVLDEITNVIDVKSSVAGLISNGDYVGAVEAIHNARSLLNGEYVGNDGGGDGGENMPPLSKDKKEEDGSKNSMLEGSGSTRYSLGKAVALNKVNDQLAQYETLVVCTVIEMFFLPFFSIQWRFHSLLIDSEGNGLIK